MPCSRSALSPSVSKERSSSSLPSLFPDWTICSIWSSNIDLLSYRSLPIRVLLPSSTLPAVVNLSKLLFSISPFIFIYFLIFISQNHFYPSHLTTHASCLTSHV